MKKLTSGFGRAVAGIVLAGATAVSAAEQPQQQQFPTDTDIATLNQQFNDLGYPPPESQNMPNIARNESFRHISVSCSAHQNTDWEGRFFVREEPVNPGAVARSNDFNLSHQYSTAALVYVDNSGQQRVILSAGEHYETTQGLWSSGTGDMVGVEQRLVGYGFTELDVDAPDFSCDSLRAHIVPVDLDGNAGPEPTS